MYAREWDEENSVYIYIYIYMCVCVYVCVCVCVSMCVSGCVYGRGSRSFQMGVSSFPICEHGSNKI